ncbi:MAG TPA: transposase, partial [Verrucomicrobiota bacterium]|nr:transposase [Verrucomicrobiota bacterium]
AVSLFTPFDRTRPLAITHRNLPHCTQEGATYFVTFRLADSLPAAVLEAWRREKEEFLARLPPPVSEEARAEAIALSTARLEDRLDEGHGRCLLREARAADEVERCLRHFDGGRYQLGSFVIMPNHVHALVRPLAGHSLAETLQGWKSVSGHRLKQWFQLPDAVWQDESFDHLVRDETRLERFTRYIGENPSRAGLKAGESRSGHGTAAWKAPTEPAAGGAPAGQRQAGAPVPLAAPAPQPSARACGEAALRAGEVAVITLAAGAGSRWTGGARARPAAPP